MVVENVYVCELQKLYIAYFGRPADPLGIEYWLKELKKSYNLQHISYTLSQQDEYTNYFEYRSTEYKINNLYLNLFNRRPDFFCLKFWMNMVNNHNYKISDIVYKLLFSKDKSLWIDLSQLDKDIDILNNKIRAAEMFTKKISKSIKLVNLYKPDSVSPWISGNSLIRTGKFFRNIKNIRISQLAMDDFINSLFDISTKLIGQPAIEIKNTTLKIPIHSIQNRSLTKRFTSKFVNITGGQLTQTKQGTNIVALNNINLTIMRGERVGLIGHNGSGKSSFLRLISGIYLPTSGNVKISVDVYPMLQKTFLTSSELSGIDACKAHYLLENNSLIGFDIFLNEIIEFSGLGPYIYLPIKTYSEGMSARLIFSILTSSPHDCLAIDEGFGTGDADFYDRAQKRMQQFMESAATLFLASHSEELLRQFCSRGIVFSHGSITYDGPLDMALNYYHTNNNYKKE